MTIPDKMVCPKKTKTKTKQQGFVTAEIAIGIFVVSTLTVSYFMLNKDKRLDQIAYTAGKQAAQVNNAIRSYIAENALSTPAGTYQNLSWLKSAAECGGTATGTVGYLPCNFSEELRLGLGYQINITNNGATVASEMVLGVPVAGGQAKPYLAGQVVLGAQGNDVTSIAPGIGNTYYTVSANDQGEVVLTASNTAGNDQYLRKDGIVKPTASFDWNNQSITNIQELSVNDKVIAANVEVSESLKLTKNNVVGASCGADSIGLDSSGNVLSCISGTWQSIVGGGGYGVVPGSWKGQCGTIYAPRGTSIYTHDIVYTWTHTAKCGSSSLFSDTVSGTGYLDTEALQVCGSSSCSVGGTWMAVAVPKKS